MIYWLGANLIVVIHFLFICFVILGALLVYRWLWLVLLHIPCVAWGAWVEYKGLICPLTPLENKLWTAGGEAGYSGGFIEHYLLPLIYIDSMNRELQMILAAAIIVVNVSLYSGLVYRLLRKH